MTGELGQIALLLALALALMLGTLPLAGAARGRADWMALARPAAQAQALLVFAAFALLLAAFAQRDFAIAYVAAHASQATPLAYRLAAAWGGHEGSLLLWLVVLAGWTLAVAQRSEALPVALRARILGVLGLLSAGLLVFLLLASNPFARQFPVPADGHELNPLLQHPAMVLHPPLLYLGYVGFAVAFAFAVAVLLTGELDARWARWLRPWTTAAWCCLTLGIALGSWWAYAELGWGGWWFWDPVENASFMPWLAGTALLHSLAATEKRGSFKCWTVLLALLTFALSLLGTFLVRSGVLSSVHAFASDPERGRFVLAYLALVVGGALALYAWRAPRLVRDDTATGFGLLSRESALLGNNLLLLVACGTVLLGTLYPLAIDALGRAPLSVGAPYFETVLLPLLGLLALLMGVGPLLRWKHDALPRLHARLGRAALSSAAAALATAWLAGGLSLGATLGFLMAAWIVSGIVLDLWDRLRPPAADGGTRFARPTLAARLPRAGAGMLLAHLGVAVFAFGVSMANSGSEERELVMRPGDTLALAGERFTLQAVEPLRGPNYGGVRALIAITRGDGSTLALRPEKRVYPTPAAATTTTEAAIASGFTRDLYVALGEALAGGAWSLRIHVKPFIGWIWGGCLLMALGGALAASDPRFRAARHRSESRAASAALSPGVIEARR